MSEKGKSNDYKEKSLDILKGLVFEDFNEKLTIIKPDNQKVKDKFRDILEDLNATWKLKYNGWIISKEKEKDFKQKLINKLSSSSSSSSNTKEKKSESRSSSEKVSSKSRSSHSSSSSDDSESSTDDELIQKVLARRFMSSSDQQEIELETIEDSENEDVISLSRRLRYLYKQIKELKEKN
jgi:hypothetical protein